MGKPYRGKGPGGSQGGQGGGPPKPQVTLTVYRAVKTADDECEFRIIVRGVYNDKPLTSFNGKLARYTLWLDGKPEKKKDKYFYLSPDTEEGMADHMVEHVPLKGFDDSGKVNVEVRLEGTSFGDRKEVSLANLEEKKGDGKHDGDKKIDHEDKAPKGPVTVKNASADGIIRCVVFFGTLDIHVDPELAKHGPKTLNFVANHKVSMTDDSTGTNLCKHATSASADITAESFRLRVNFLACGETEVEIRISLSGSDKFVTVKLQYRLY